MYVGGAHQRLNIDFFLRFLMIVLNLKYKIRCKLFEFLNYVVNFVHIVKIFVQRKSYRFDEYNKVEVDMLKMNVRSFISTQ